jgi:hypothetical protein
MLALPIMIQVYFKLESRLSSAPGNRRSALRGGAVCADRRQGLGYTIRESMKS